MNSILITGSNRGLGLGLVREMVNSKKYPMPKYIFATCRNPEQAEVIWLIFLLDFPFRDHFADENEFFFAVKTLTIDG